MLYTSVHIFVNGVNRICVIDLYGIRRLITIHYNNIIQLKQSKIGSMRTFYCTSVDCFIFLALASTSTSNFRLFHVFKSCNVYHGTRLCHQLQIHVTLGVTHQQGQLIIPRHLIQFRFSLYNLIVHLISLFDCCFLSY